MNASATISISHVLRCIGCDSRISAREATGNFRCAHCGELFEIEYPWSEGAPAGVCPVWKPNPGALKHLWEERRTSTQGVDQSGVWRFRELLPIVSEDQVVTLR